jgi:hypothetical protein
MGLILQQAPKTPMPEALIQFIALINTGISRQIFTDGSFALDTSLLDNLSCTALDLTARFGKAATGVYAPPSDGAPPTALILHTPFGSAIGAYYQELLGTTVTTLISTITPIHAFSDCSSAITRALQALSPMGTAVGHLQHGALLQGIRMLSSKHRHPFSLTWTKSHPEGRKNQHLWTLEDWGIHKADELAGTLDETNQTTDLKTFHCNAEDVHAVLTLPGTWQ